MQAALKLGVNFFFYFCALLQTSTISTYGFPQHIPHQNIVYFALIGPPTEKVKRQTILFIISPEWLHNLLMFFVCPSSGCCFIIPASVVVHERNIFQPRKKEKKNPFLSASLEFFHLIYFHSQFLRLSRAAIDDQQPSAVSLSL